MSAPEWCGIEVFETASYISVAFFHQPAFHRYYCRYHFCDGSIDWLRHQGYGFADLKIPEAGVPAGGVDFAITALTAYRLTGHASRG